MNIIKYKKIFLPVLVVLTLLIGFVWSLSRKDKIPKLVQQNNVVNLVNATEFKQLVDEDAFVLDVHTPKQEPIPGTDAFIPYDEIVNNIDKLPTDKNTKIAVYCRSGSMSAIVAEELAGLGYKNVYDLEGGINTYRETNAQVTILPESADLGEVVYGDVVQTRFVLTNFTPSALKLTRISTSCSCTSAKVEKTELEPYESIDVNVYFDPAIHEDDTDLGDVTRVIFIETDNPNFPQVEASFKAFVVKNPN